jgi:hypothetical protein
MALSLLKKDCEVQIITSNLKNNQTIEKKPNFSVVQIHFYNKIEILIEIYKNALNFKPDIVLNIEPLTMLVGYFLKKKLNCRLIYDAHEFYAEAFAERHKHCFYPYLWFEKLLASRMDAVIAVNDELSKRFKTPTITAICPNYPSLSSFPELSENEKLYDVIYAGCLWFERGLKIYLETANLFKKSNTPFKMLLIGSFKNRETEIFFNDYVAKNQLQDNIEYKPFIPQEEVLKEMQKAKVGLFMGDITKSPRYDKSISMKILEYYSQGIPVVINELKLLGDFVNKSNGGWIIYYSECDLFILLKDILNNDNLLKEKALNGYNFVKKNAVWENVERWFYKAVFGT